MGVSLRQKCVISPWLCSIDKDEIMREVNRRVIDKNVEFAD